MAEKKSTKTKKMTKEEAIRKGRKMMGLKPNDPNHLVNKKITITN